MGSKKVAAWLADASHATPASCLGLPEVQEHDQVRQRWLPDHRSREQPDICQQGQQRRHEHDSADAADRIGEVSPSSLTHCTDWIVICPATLP